MRRNFCILAVGSLLALSATAIVPPTGDDAMLKSRPAWVRAPELDATPSLDYMEPGHPRAAKVPGVARFFDENSKDWTVSVDTRNNRPNLIQARGGQDRGMPWIPGVGNNLQWEGLDLKRNSRLLDDVADMARAFMGRHPDFFGVDQADLVLDESQSGVFDNGRLMFVTFQQTYEGIPVDGAIVFFRLNGGNLVSFGSDRVAEVKINTRANFNRDGALQRALDYAGFAASEITELTSKLKIVPTLPPGNSAGHAYAGVPGNGYRHALVREISFRRADDDATYSAIVDAKSGQILQLIDANLYAVTGAVVQTYGASDGPVLTFPTNTTTTTGPCTALNGVNFRMLDVCGTINVCDSADANSGNGNVDMGSSAGHDCSTPGFGGAGNTRSSRSGFYHLTQIRNEADTFHPTNTWLDSKVTANMNINNTCNAFWNGSTVNFYRSGGGCGNTGEIPAVFLHEWGHGFDTNTGGAASEAASGEAVGDTFAALYMQDACIGPGFLSTTCHNCTTCTGVRDLKDFSASGTKLRATPANITNDSGINCDRWACPFTGYMGPMGYEGHCEAVIAGSAMWNLTQDIGFPATRSLWYNSLIPSKSAFRVASGGQCNTSATVDGCGATNWHTVLQDIDTGTYDCAIWDAFSAQGIACGSRPSPCGGGGGAVCGNNVKEAGEVCDGTDLGGATCVSQGFSGGTLSCNSGCASFNTSACTSGGGGGVLTNHVPKTGQSATTGNSLSYTMVTTAGTGLTFTTTGSNGDADLYVKFGSAPTLSSYDCRSWSSSSNETCNIGTAQAGTYHVMVYAYSTFTGLSVQGDYTASSGCGPYYDSLSGISGAYHTWNYYTQNITCSASMTVKISGGTGDADLYVRKTTNPTLTSYLCRPWLSGNNETCVISATAGDYKIGIYAYAAYAGVLLEVSY